MTTFTAAVAGASGYAGGEVLRLLSAHPDVEIGAVTAASSAGSRLGEHQPHLVSLADRVIQPTDASTLGGHDVVFLGLPHGESGRIAAELGDDVLVIDCGADHRLESAEDWTAFYGSEHAGTWPYGLPELFVGTGRQRDHLAGVRRIAVPGCNVTAVTLGLQPAVSAGIVAADDLVAVLANGFSGAGKAPKAHLLASEGLGAASPYGVGGVHRHVPEIVQNLTKAGGEGVTISFTPTLVPMARGILATSTARLADGVDAARVRAVYEEAYGGPGQGEPFVHLLPEGQWPTTAATLGANTAQLQVAVDEAAGRLVVTSVIDNLVKGTAGGAIQSMNLALGLPETTGLTTTGVAP
ncbi:MULTISPECIES: N-acetyl-gamma-glutamyl-phosphate reductase [unclassified Aeromicrobium]|uniref:N-acetyl-gamma-glutamyl-phosphate reductase n=1 Tax=unclassified Aeromicrobium TaxID=2633570 RepID=UPI0006F41AAD|nr:MULTISPECIES: N-acetyl-gamma-glutamyl-phosphate reductase [unclassified Aeromicrobium]KQO38191.1 N-acetyl-gamma-glutamyl-phosphate reductase [Aeromicrobium sp. Leaf245]KQP24419.1 N-acetyl-gamma-glutamyl-phosphate reductase [Aeromicrobium sp. Leaf272]